MSHRGRPGEQQAWWLLALTPLPVLQSQILDPRKTQIRGKHHSTSVALVCTVQVAARPLFHWLTALRAGNIKQKLLWLEMLL